MIKWLENPTEVDFPLIDRCIVCDEICTWQPRYEIFARSMEHKALLAAKRPLNYRPEYRVVCICAGCIPPDNDKLRRMIRKNYPVYAKEREI